MFIIISSWGAMRSFANLKALKKYEDLPTAFSIESLELYFLRNLGQHAEDVKILGGADKLNNLVPGYYLRFVSSAVDTQQALVYAVVVNHSQTITIHDVLRAAVRNDKKFCNISKNSIYAFLEHRDKEGAHYEIQLSLIKEYFDEHASTMTRDCASSC